MLVAGQVQQTTMRQIAVDTITAENIQQSLKPLENVGDVFVSGSVQGKLLDNGTTVQINGDRANFYHAATDTLAGTDQLRQVSLSVQVRHDVGVQVPEVTVQAVQPTSTISESLLKWIE